VRAVSRADGLALTISYKICDSIFINVRTPVTGGTLR